MGIRHLGCRFRFLSPLWLNILAMDYINNSNNSNLDNMCFLRFLCLHLLWLRNLLSLLVRMREVEINIRGLDQSWRRIVNSGSTRMKMFGITLELVIGLGRLPLLLPLLRPLDSDILITSNISNHTIGMSSHSSSNLMRIYIVLR